MSAYLPASSVSRSIRIGVLGFGVAAFWLWSSRDSLPSWLFPFSQQKELGSDRKKVLEILNELCAEFHSVFSELAQVAQSIQRSIANRGLQNALPAEQMEAMLMQQGFQQRLEVVEARVLHRFNIEKSELQAASKRFDKDAEISLLTAGLSVMYADAIKGVLPLLPGVEVPESLSSASSVLSLLGEIQRKKIELFEQIFLNATPEEMESQQSPVGALPSPQLNARLTGAADKAEAEVLKKNKSICISPKLYSHALASHLRDPEFKKKKSIMDELHSDQVVDLMKKGMRSKSAGPVLVVLHDKLEQVKADDLRLLVDSANDDKRPLICMVTKKTNNNIGMQLLESYSSACADFEKKEAEKFLCASYLFGELAELNEAGLVGVPQMTAAQTPCFLKFEGSSYKGQTSHLSEAFDFVLESLVNREATAEVATTGDKEEPKREEEKLEECETEEEENKKEDTEQSVVVEEATVEDSTVEEIIPTHDNSRPADSSPLDSSTVEEIVTPVESDSAELEEPSAPTPDPATPDPSIQEADVKASSTDAEDISTCATNISSPVAGVESN